MTIKTFEPHDLSRHRLAEAAHVRERLLCAIDQFESGQTALAYVTGVASANESSVRLLHLREVPRMARALPLETPIEAEEVLRDAVLTLQRLGVAADGRSCSVQQDHVAKHIVREALLWECQAIVLGSRRLRGIGRLSGGGVRERILRNSFLPALVAPAAESNGIYSPPRFYPSRSVLRHHQRVAPPWCRQPLTSWSWRGEQCGNGRDQRGHASLVRSDVDPGHLVHRRCRQKATGRAATRQEDHMGGRFVVGLAALWIIGAAIAELYLVGPRRKMNAQRW